MGFKRSVMNIQKDAQTKRSDVELTHRTCRLQHPAPLIPPPDGLIQEPMLVAFSAGLEACMTAGLRAGYRARLNVWLVPIYSPSTCLLPWGSKLGSSKQDIAEPMAGLVCFRRLGICCGRADDRKLWTAWKQPSLVYIYLLNFLGDEELREGGVRQKHSSKHPLHPWSPYKATHISGLLSRLWLGGE